MFYGYSVFYSLISAATRSLKSVYDRSLNEISVLHSIRLLHVHRLLYHSLLRVLIDDNGMQLQAPMAMSAE